MKNEKGIIEKDEWPCSDLSTKIDCLFFSSIEAFHATPFFCSIFLRKTFIHFFTFSADGEEGNSSEFNIAMRISWSKETDGFETVD